MPINYEPPHRWDPRMDQLMMLRSVRVSAEVLASCQGHAYQMLRWTAATYKKLPPPTWEERLERCETLSSKIVAANLILLAQRVRSQPLPTFLRPYERLTLSGLGRRTEVTEAMKASRGHLGQTDFYVTLIVAPGLLFGRFANPWKGIPPCARIQTGRGTVSPDP